MTEWIYFIHPPRDDFAATMTAAEKTVWAEHFERLQRLLASGQLILAGPTLGTVNTGLVIFKAPDEQAARRVMAEDPVVLGGYARGEVRPFRVSLLRGRD
ncbi:MAG: YciI family protein [Streptosporangiaceae bacterium]